MPVEKLLLGRETGCVSLRFGEECCVREEYMYLYLAPDVPNLQGEQPE